jgi:hypothetical protein
MRVSGEHDSLRLYHAGKFGQTFGFSIQPGWGRWDRNHGNRRKTRQMANGQKLALIFRLIIRFDLDIECGGAQARANTNALGCQTQVGSYFRRPNVRSALMDRHIDLAEFQLGDGP